MSGARSPSTSEKSALREPWEMASPSVRARVNDVTIPERLTERAYATGATVAAAFAVGSGPDDRS